MNREEDLSSLTRLVADVYMSKFVVGFMFARTYTQDVVGFVRGL